MKTTCFQHSYKRHWFYLHINLICVQSLLSTVYNSPVIGTVHDALSKLKTVVLSPKYSRQQYCLVFHIITDETWRHEGGNFMSVMLWGMKPGSIGDQASHHFLVNYLFETRDVTESARLMDEGITKNTAGALESSHISTPSSGELDRMPWMMVRQGK
jgi:hypothetical protein